MLLRQHPILMRIVFWSFPHIYKMRLSRRQMYKPPPRSSETVLLKPLIILTIYRKTAEKSRTFYWVHRLILRKNNGVPNQINSDMGFNDSVNTTVSHNEGNVKRNFDKNKSQQWSQSRGLQLPKLADTIDDNISILQKEDIVNNNSKDNFDNNVRFSLKNDDAEFEDDGLLPWQREEDIPDDLPWEEETSTSETDEAKPHRPIALDVRRIELDETGNENKPHRPIALDVRRINLDETENDNIDSLLSGGNDTDFLTQPIGKIKNEFELAKARAESRKGKVYTRADALKVAESIVGNIDTGTGAGVTMSKCDKGGVVQLVGYILNKLFNRLTRSVKIVIIITYRHDENDRNERFNRLNFFGTVLFNSHCIC